MQSKHTLYLGCILFLGADRNRFGKLIEDTENNYVKGQDQYPKTVVPAYNMKIYCKQDPQNLMRILGTRSSKEIAFTNLGNGDQTAWTNVVKRTNPTSHPSNARKKVTTQMNVCRNRIKKKKLGLKCFWQVPRILNPSTY